MAPWTGFGVMLAFAAFLLVIAFFILERRDA
jgi:asparagine N-glycosylation enzyme membrane subunit Stt3